MFSGNSFVSPASTSSHHHHYSSQPQQASKFVVLPQPTTTGSASHAPPTSGPYTLPPSRQGPTNPFVSGTTPAQASFSAAPTAAGAGYVDPTPDVSVPSLSTAPSRAPTTPVFGGGVAYTGPSYVPSYPPVQSYYPPPAGLGVTAPPQWAALGSSVAKFTPPFVGGTGHHNTGGGSYPAYPPQYVTAAARQGASDAPSSGDADIDAMAALPKLNSGSQFTTVPVGGARLHY